MAFRLGAEIEQFNIRAGGQQIRLYYRPPTTPERLAYRIDMMRCVSDPQNSSFQLSERFAGLAADYGAKIVLGVGPEDIVIVADGRQAPLVGEVTGIDEKGRPISGREHPAYRSDWLQVLVDQGHFLLDALGQAVFNPVSDPDQPTEKVKN